MSTNSFIANVNLVAQYLKDIRELNLKLDEDKIRVLLELAILNIKAIADDLSKDTYFGNRQIDINLFKNYRDYYDGISDEELEELINYSLHNVRYSGVTVTFNDYSEKLFNFYKEGSLDFVLTNQELFIHLANILTPVNHVDTTEVILNSADIVDYTVTIADTLDSTNLNQYSNILSLTFHAVEGDPYKVKDYSLSWEDSTSALKFLVSHINMLMYLAQNAAKLLEVPSDVQELVDRVTIMNEQIIVMYDFITNLHDSLVNSTNDLNEFKGRLQEDLDKIEHYYTDIIQWTAEASHAALKAQESQTVVTEIEKICKEYRDELVDLSISGVKPATTSTLGGIIIGSYLNVTSNGTLSIPLSTTSIEGVVRLSNAIQSTTERGYAATPLAVKTVNDKVVSCLEDITNYKAEFDEYKEYNDTIVSGLVSGGVTLTQVRSEINELAVSLTGDTMTGGLTLPELRLDNVTMNIVQDGSRKKLTFTF